MIKNYKGIANSADYRVIEITSERGEYISLLTDVSYGPFVLRDGSLSEYERLIPFIQRDHLGKYLIFSTLTGAFGIKSYLIDEKELTANYIPVDEWNSHSRDAYEATKREEEEQRATEHREAVSAARAKLSKLAISLEVPALRVTKGLDVDLSLLVDNVSITGVGFEVYTGGYDADSDPYYDEFVWGDYLLIFPLGHAVGLLAKDYESFLAEKCAS